MSTGPHWFRRYLLPGLAFKAVVIGGGYATGREIAEFFLPSGAKWGLAAMGLAALVWSLVCVLTFLIARAARALDYRTFFKALLGRGWIAFELAYLLFVVLILAVFGAAAGAIGAATLGWPPLAGTLVLMLAIAAFAAFGNASVERLFAYVSILLYGVYALFFVFAISKYGDRMLAGFHTVTPVSGSWALDGLTYAAYNVVGAVVILPVVRHLTSSRDAVIAGCIAGPLAMLPAILFFLCMLAFMPAIASEVLPSDYMLARLGHPAFHLLFQAMIFAALLESGTGAVHAINERMATAWRARTGKPPGVGVRWTVSIVLLAVCMLVADRVGLVSLIANGYRVLAGVILAIYVLPLVTFGLWRLLNGRFRPQEL